MRRYFNFKKLTVAALAFVIALALALPAAHAGEVWKQKFVRFSATAGETLAIGDVVCIKNADGKAWKADADSSTLRPAVGVIDKGGAADATVEIVVEGILAGQTELSEGYRLFLSETGGAMTTTGPTNAQTVGFVLPAASGDTGPSKSSRYFIKVAQPTSGGAGY